MYNFGSPWTYLNVTLIQKTLLRSPDTNHPSDLRRLNAESKQLDEQLLNEWLNEQQNPSHLCCSSYSLVWWPSPVYELLLCPHGASLPFMYFSSFFSVFFCSSQIYAHLHRIWRLQTRLFRNGAYFSAPPMVGCASRITKHELQFRQVWNVHSQSWKWDRFNFRKLRLFLSLN